MNYTKTWQEIYEKLTKSLPDHAIRTWFEPINSIALVENEIVLEVPNQFFFEWIESHYRDELLDSIASVS